MSTNDDQGNRAKLDTSTLTEAKADRRRARLQIERAAILEAVRSLQPTTLTQRVALVLNQFPETRNSDLALQLRYWRAFNGYEGGSIDPAWLYRWVRLTSIARSRARIQNEHKLFLADEEVQRKRRVLSEDQLQQAREGKHDRPESYTVYLDESGTKDETVFVGGLWCMDGIDTMRLVNGLGNLRRASGKKGELHFIEVRHDTLPLFTAAVDLAVASSTFSFKYLAVSRRGLGDVNEAIEKLMYHLVADGIAHEHDSGRAPLPRMVNIVKDQGAEGRDPIACAEIADRLQAINGPRFKGKLQVGTVEAMSSEEHPLLQLTDLLVSSVRRIRSRTARNSSSPKDILADHVVSRVGLPVAGQLDGWRDLAVEIRL